MPGRLAVHQHATLTRDATHERRVVDAARLIQLRHCDVVRQQRCLLAVDRLR